MDIWQDTTNGLAIKSLLGIAVGCARRIHGAILWWSRDGVHRVAVLCLGLVLMNRLLVESGGSPSLKMRTIILGAVPVLWLANATLYLRHQRRRLRALARL
jgi:hypothetical protein